MSDIELVELNCIEKINNEYKGKDINGSILTRHNYQQDIKALIKTELGKDIDFRTWYGRQLWKLALESFCARKVGK